MLVHHICFIFLIGISYSFNMTRHGIAVLMCHEPGDAACYLLRCARGTKLKYFMIVAWVNCVFWWTYLRLYVLPCVIIKEFIYPVYRDEFMFVRISGSFALMCLVVLHFFWLLKIFQALRKSMRSGKAEDPTRKEQ